MKIIIRNFFYIMLCILGRTSLHGMINNQETPHDLFINCKYNNFAPLNIDENITELCCRELSNNHIDQIITLFPNLQNLTIDTSNEINDKSLEYLLNKTLINKLTLIHCPFIRFTSIAPESFKNITHLCINRCNNIKDTGLNIIPYLENLYQLDIIDCEKITGAGLQGINTLSFLSKISVQWCKKISHHFFNALTDCATLSELEIAGAPMIKNDDFNILNTLPQLKTITLKNCKNLTHEILPQLSAFSSSIEQCQKINFKEYHNNSILIK